MGLSHSAGPEERWINHFRVDFWKVNAITHKDAYSIPRVDDSLDTLAGVEYFSTLDLISGYWQIEVSPEDCEKTAFCTHEGFLNFKVMPFGLCNAPATFQRLMDRVSAGLQWSSCLVYLDDTIIIGKTFEEHLENLKGVFDRLQGAGLKRKPGMCDFSLPQVPFLGHIVSADGVRTDPMLTVKVAQWPRPTSKRRSSFLGLQTTIRDLYRFLLSLLSHFIDLQRRQPHLSGPVSVNLLFMRFVTGSPPLQF